ncbi:acyl carrier protein [Chitinimonas sp.]|uniref:acyl carrier protein n=1 Tax=Chitinimonas sp. TaxID=1934313 RepID=UPI0035B4DE51
MSSTLKQLQDLIVEKYGIAIEELAPEKGLADFGLDSLSQVELLFSVEEHFKIEIPEERAQVANLNALAALVDSILAESAA